MDWSAVWQAVQAIGQVLGGLGIAGALFTWLYQRHRDQTQRQNELEGLLRMLLVEIEENERHFRAYEARPALITNMPHGPRWGVWESARMRLAQLLTEEHTLSELASCYDMIQQVEKFRHIGEDKMEEKDVIEEVESRIPTILDRCQNSAARIKAPVPDAIGSRLPPSAIP